MLAAKQLKFGCGMQIAIYRCLLDITAGMDYLHSLGVLHGDLKVRATRFADVMTKAAGHL